MQSLRNFETLFLGLADTRAGEHEFRGRYVWAESLLNPVPRMFAARRNPQKTVLSRERRACQNAQQSLKNATGTDFENAAPRPKSLKIGVPGRPGTVPGRPGGALGQVSRGRPGVPLRQVSRAFGCSGASGGGLRGPLGASPPRPPGVFGGPRGPLGACGFASQGVGFGSRFRVFFGLPALLLPDRP